MYFSSLANTVIAAEKMFGPKPDMQIDNLWFARHGFNKFFHAFN